MDTASKPDYSTHDPKGWCGDPRRGAALGRPTVKGSPGFEGKIYLRRVYLDMGGYDRNGTYFGHGNPLYWYADADGEIDGMLRAKASYDWKVTRADAREQVLALYPEAKIRR
jgi:hypothetical protein